MASDRVKSPIMVVPNVVYLHVFPVCFHHVVVSTEPCSRCLVTAFVRSTCLLEEVCASYEL